jgi:peptidoglycan/LPS O-acetylase OafA/YrhL
MLGPMSPPTDAAGSGARIPRAMRVTLLANHYPPLHGMRVIAIVLVVQIHLTGTLSSAGLIPSTAWKFSVAFWFAMDLFFLLSGFLIGSMLLADSPAGKRVDVGRFYLRRTFRIVPPYLVVLTLLARVLPLNPAQHSNLWREYFYLTNYVPPSPELVVMPWGWSLALEEHFYLLVPLLVGALRLVRSRKVQLAALFLLWASAPLLRAWVYVKNGPWTEVKMAEVFYVQSHLRFDILIAGIFTACVQRYYGAELGKWLEHRGARWLLAGLSAAAFVALLATSEIQHTFYRWDLLCWGTITSLAYAPLVLLLLNWNSALSRVLSHRAFAYLATLGYGIYLIHPPVIEALVPMEGWVEHTLELPWLVFWTISLAVALGCAALASYVLHLTVEKPALLLRDRLT